MGALLLCLISLTAYAEQPLCNQRVLLAELRSTDPVFSDAMNLKQGLTEAGFDVECVLASKMTAFIEGQKGAAQFRTSGGIFEALFAVESNGFKQLEIVETKPQPPYNYVIRSKTGSLQVRHMEGNRPAYFVKRPNLMLIIWDAELAQSLASALEHSAPDAK